jgi:putative pyoverdin transport system ATP-binding/permease protein
MNIFSQTIFYFLLAAVVFILPLIISIQTDEMTRLTATMLFLMGPIGALVGGMQQYAASSAAAENIENLEAAIDQHVRPMASRRAESLIILEEPFRDLTFDQVLFSYGNGVGEVPFELGPLDLSISPGETIFVAGGNGSGKSTFLRLLTCLYFPTKGELRLDGQRLSESNAASYRNLFAVIFYDYHLFDYLYGIHNVDVQQVDELLEKLQLNDKTRLVDNRFETLDLSTGQRRRLALLVNYLENKPICVFDEWAAEQDPYYRRYFYTDILPELKARGKTVIAVTHDDRYYDMDYVDRILRFEEGRLISPGTTPHEGEVAT